MPDLPLRRWAAVRLYGKQGFRPNAWALEHIYGRDERFICGVTTRQTGKSSEGGMVLDAAMCAAPDLRGAPWVGILAPTYDKCDLIIQPYIEMLTDTFGPDSYRLNQNKHELEIIDPIAGTDGARLKWLSADDPYGVIGYTFSALITDESQAIPDEVFFKIRPTLDVRNARMISFGTSDITIDQSWFQSMWMRGQDPLDTNYHSFRVTAYENPWMSLETIEDAKSSLSEAEFRRLYLAEWVDLDGRVFTNFEGALLDNIPLYQPTLTHSMAVDFAATEDFNVVMVGQNSIRAAIYKDRWNNISTIETMDRVADINHRFGKPICYIDATGLGGKAFADGLRQRGVRVHEVNFSNKSKMELITSLAADLQHRSLMFPRAWEDTIRELKAFLYKRTNGGLLTANAAAGYHDDCVVTLAMLNTAMKNRRSSGRQYSYLERSPYELASA